MPRPNPLRAIQAEANLARRVAFERSERGMTYDALAKVMTDAGCPIQGSAIFKIEKGDPPRRITVDELVAFGCVFDIATDELLMPWTTATERERRIEDEAAKLDAESARLSHAAAQLRTELKALR